MNLQGHRNDASESRPGYLYLTSLVCLDSTSVWLSCQPIIWISSFTDSSGFLQIRSHMFQKLDRDLRIAIKPQL